MLPTTKLINMLQYLILFYIFKLFKRKLYINMNDEKRKEAIHDLGYLAGRTARETLNGGFVGAGLAGVGHWVSAVVQSKKSVGISTSGKTLGIGAAIGAS